MTAFTTTGPVRGDCGHRHRSIEAALDCIGRDGRGCRASSGPAAYSDRRVVALGGDAQRPLTDLECAAMVGQLERREGGE